MTHAPQQPVVPVVVPVAVMAVLVPMRVIVAMGVAGLALVSRRLDRLLLT